MGRALGVLHATGPEGAPPTAEQIAQLTTLATQAGARIGTVRAFEKTQLQASTDALTGLVNRRTFETQVRGLIKQQRQLALAVGDLDHFKPINDTHGHEAGDRALRLFAHVAQDALRDDDILARWGGEEFVFVAPRPRPPRGGARARPPARATRRSADRQRPPLHRQLRRHRLEPADTLEQLLQIADHGLYTPSRGRDRVTIGEADLVGPQPVTETRR